MDVLKNSIDLLYHTLTKFSGAYTVNNLEDLKRELSNCTIMPNQMIYAASYKPFNVFFSKNTEKLLGIKEGKFEVTDTFQLIYLEDKDFIINAISESFKWLSANPAHALDIMFSLEYRIKHTQGHFITVQRITRVVAIDNSDKPSITLSVVIDISLLRSNNFIAKAVMQNALTGEHFYSLTNNKNSGIKISAREKQVLQLICQGLSSKEISAKLFISKHTVDGHRRTLLKKTTLTNTAELVTFALQNNLL